MRFTLQNLGRLREATIDLGKDLILLTGPNNTSKTYVAYSIYGFCEELERNLASILRPFVPRGDGSNHRLDVDVAGLIRDHREAIAHRLGDQYKDQLANVLAADDAFAAKAKVTIDWSAEEATSRLPDLLGTEQRQSFSSLPSGRDISIKKPRDSGVFSFSWSENAEASDIHEIAVEVISRAFAQIFFPGIASFFILTAERSAIQLFSSELSLRRGKLVDSLLERGTAGAAGSPLKLLDQRARRYPLPIRDSLRMADNLAIFRMETSPYAPLADRLEREIMQGAIRLGDDGEMTFQPEQSDGRLSMHLSSSSVKALSGLSLYLRHLAQQGQLLIIDEPELNLHPDNQRRVARVLARLARSGVKVMISTHSDYVIREINNLIMLSADRDGDLRLRHGYAEGETLSPAQVGAYLFDAEAARPIEVKPTGIEVKTIDEEINRLNTAAQDIYFSLFEKSDQ